MARHDPVGVVGMASAQPLPLLLTVDEAAAQLGLNRATLYPLVMGGAIRSVKIGRARRIPASELQIYIRRLMSEQGDQPPAA